MHTPRRNKRPRGTPTFLTPVRPNKRVPLRELALVHPLQPKKIIPQQDRRGLSWKDEEVGALVEFVLLHCKGDSWPCHSRMTVWNAAAQFVKERTSGENQRSGS